MKKDIREEYFNWMYSLVTDENDSSRISYRLLLEHLYSRDFEYSILMDQNREADGIELRYRFGKLYGYSRDEIADTIDRRAKCSVLEMMIVLCIRCEEHIMADDDVGDRTGQWFWNMIVSLGLGYMTDDRYNPVQVDIIVDRFLDRDYEPNGRGGMFTIENFPGDMRDVEIWYQMCYYLDDFLD